MTFVIITHVLHIQEQNQFFAYAPYVREMNIWTKYVDKVILVAPKSRKDLSPIDCSYEHHHIDFISIDSFDLLSVNSILKAILTIPKICCQIFTAMKKADHIHLRCPGNVGLLGSIIQIFFPQKTKTAKYAGNWDPKSNQPLSYRLQKWILSDTFLTRNMQVLVYGEWDSCSKNIKPFFTATYSESEILAYKPKNLNSTIQFTFAGSLVSGKNPLYAIQLVEKLYQRGHDVSLNLYGEGKDKIISENYVKRHQLTKIINFAGNQSGQTLKDAYIKSHFVILPSESEGWPKAIAEGMFLGSVPVATPVSCVPFMMDYGARGILLKSQLDDDALQLESLLENEILFHRIGQKAMEWSQQFTLNKFDDAVKKIMQE